MCRSTRYGYRLTTSPEATAAYNRGVGDLLGLRTGAVEALAASVALDPTFALGHAALALLGHEMCAPVDVAARLRDALLHADGPRSANAATSTPSPPTCAATRARWSRHLAAHPRDALLLTTAVPTIAFAGVTEVPAEGWVLVERAIPAYGEDWWFAGLLAFVRQEQRRFDEAMSLSCGRSPRSRTPATRPMRAPTPTTRPATTRPAWPGWTAG